MVSLFIWLTRSSDRNVMAFAVEQAALNGVDDMISQEQKT